MTERRIARLKAIIEESRASLLEENPSFAVLLMYLRFVAVLDMKKISTDGITVFFNPQFLEKLRRSEVDYLLCHQIMHIVMGHTEAAASLGADLEDFHFACDIYVNSSLEGAGFPLKRFTHLGELCCEIPWKKEFKVTDKTEKEIYRELPLSLSYFEEKIRNGFLADSHDFWDGYAVKKGDTVIIDFPKLDSETELSLPRQEEDGTGGGKNGLSEGGGGLKAHLRAALKATQNRYGKNEESLLERAWKRRSRPTLDWRKLLIEFLQEEINDYSFMPPDRRYDDMPFFLPDFNEKDYAIKEILFMVDTSGSISEAQLSAVYSEISGVIEQFCGKISGKIAFFDNRVYPAVAFQAVQDILKIVPWGGGGTSFDIIFDYVQEACNNDRPSCVIIFTDGEADYPEEEQAMGIPVFWIINNEKSTPTWGRIARMPV